MEIKKSDKVNLDKKKGLFLEIGLIVALALVFFGFESKSSPRVEATIEVGVREIVEEEIIPITRQEELKTPPPPTAPPAITDFLTIESDDVELSTDFSIDVEATETTVIVEPVVFESTKEEEVVEEEEIFIRVEEMPTFNGQSADTFHAWVQQHISYPTVAAENGVSGRVFVQFAINARGELVDARVVRGVDASLDREALRVLNSCPKGMWKPGMQAGKPVKVQFNFPVVFSLQ